MLPGIVRAHGHVTNGGARTLSQALIAPQVPSIMPGNSSSPRCRAATKSLYHARRSRGLARALYESFYFSTCVTDPAGESGAIECATASLSEIEKRGVDEIPHADEQGQSEDSGTDRFSELCDRIHFSSPYMAGSGHGGRINQPLARRIGRSQLRHNAFEQIS